MRSISLFIFIEIILVSSAVTSTAQTRLKWEAGINLSMFTYQGDLTPSWAGSTATPGYGFSLFANRIYSNVLSFRTSINYGKIRANDAGYAQPDWRQQRNFAFSSSLIEISETAVWSPFGNTGVFGLPIAPYLMGGIGAGIFNVRRDAGEFNAEYFAASPQVSEGLTEDLATAPPKSLIILPVGAGIRVPVTSHWSLQSEYVYRFTATDYLDGFSKSAGPGKKDRYTSYNIGLVYTFGNYGNIKCPPVFRKRFKN